jgi:hypothetical protein
MKLPNNMSTTVNTTKVDEIESITLEFDKLTSFDYKFTDFDDPKELRRYITQIEQSVRRSYEYRKYIKYLKEEKNLKSCKFFDRINIDDIKKVSLEFHHYPFNLYEIVDTVLKKQTNFYQDPVNTFDVINEVGRIHYENMVGLVPLTKTVHELAHNGEIFINFKDVHGNVEKFINDYREYIDEELLESIQKLSILSEKNSQQSNKFILKKKFQNISISDRDTKKVETASKEQTA